MFFSTTHVIIAILCLIAAIFLPDQIAPSVRFGLITLLLFLRYAFRKRKA